MAGPTVPPQDVDDGGEGGGLDPRIVLELFSFVARALRRHVRVALALSLGLAGATFVFVRLLPKTYHVETTLLAQNNQVIAALGNPGRAVPYDNEGPTRAVAETVQRRDNLVAIIRQTGLVEHWRQTRHPLGRLKDRVTLWFHRPLTDDELVDVLVFVLETKLLAWSHEGKVTIACDWHDPATALRIVEAAQQNFLETRHVTDTSIIAESISILEGHLDTAREEVTAALATARGRRAGTPSAGAPRPSSAAAPPASGGARVPGDAGPKREELARLRTLLDTQRRAVRDLEDFRQKRLGELQGQLAEQKAVYADSHPLVVTLRQSIEALSQDSPQLAALRRELHDLEAQYLAKGGSLAEATAELLPATRIAAPETIVLRDSGPRDPTEEYAQQRLGAAISRYNSLVARIEGARMELDAARAAFKYRYIVVQPPRPPKKAVGPKTGLLSALGTFAGLVLGLCAALLLELRHGRIVQAWQVHRLLGVPVLVELPR
jgi:uncharacterized protein involved in exopolysaccharide biosynthesis